MRCRNLHFFIWVQLALWIATEPPDMPIIPCDSMNNDDIHKKCIFFDEKIIFSVLPSWSEWDISSTQATRTQGYKRITMLVQALKIVCYCALKHFLAELPTDLGCRGIKLAGHQDRFSYWAEVK